MSLKLVFLKNIPIKINYKYFILYNKYIIKWENTTPEDLGKTLILIRTRPSKFIGHSVGAFKLKNILNKKLF